ncbi:MAG: EF-hand domain-containing protein [Fluviibacter sp.]
MKLQAGMFAVLLSALSFNVCAEESFKDRQIEALFAAADKNHDGKLTLEEAQAGMPKVAANFDKIDTGKLGYVTLDQIKAAANR